MRVLFWRKKKQKTGKIARGRPRLKYGTASDRRSQRRDDEILLKLDAIMAYLRKHDIDVKDTLEQLAVARRTLREANLDGIIKEKLTHGIEPKDIVKELVSQEACSRATAYRYLSRQSKLLRVSAKSH